jgi:Holliday junction resolvase RusA-like endonuclease
MFIRVYGEPAPQGSKTAIVRNGRAILFESSKKLPAWRETVDMTCRVAAMEHQVPLLGPIELEITFHMPRGKSVSRQYPNTQPDLDKLIRGVGDSLQSSGVLSNDGQIVSVQAHKIYASSPEDVGCEIVIQPKR